MDASSLFFIGWAEAVSSMVIGSSQSDSDRVAPDPAFQGEVSDRICVAVCTRNRPDHLRRALNALRAQRVKPAEILVVDNAPDGSETRRLVQGEFAGVRYVEESIPGLDVARNRALAESSREIVAFVDDDVVVEPDWVAAIGKVFDETDRIAVCTGKVEALSLETEGQRLFEANGGFARGDKRIRLSSNSRGQMTGFPMPLIAWSISIGSGCSMAVRRSVILGLGGFDEALDRGPALPGGGDHDILWRCLQAGHDVVYDPSVQGKHEHRRELDASVNQILEHNRALIAVLVKSAGTARRGTRISILAFLVWRLVKPGARLLRKLAGRDPLPFRVLLQLWWNCWLGLGAYRPQGVKR
jgi:glycosyltransferase involved in cell wall biosynthesis